MATRAFHPPQSLDTLLAAIPSLPRPLLDRLVAHMIDHIDEVDGDADLEDDDPDTSVEDDPQGIDPEEDLGIEDQLEGPEESDAYHDLRPIADPEAYREHRARLRKDRCWPLSRVRRASFGYQERMLSVEPTVPSKRQLLRRKRGIPRRPRA
jgi:hypothetical protein